MIERRKKRRNEYLEQLEKECKRADYTDEELKQVCQLIKLDIWTDILLDKTHEW